MMSDKKLPIFREILCDLCDSKHTKQCDRDEFQPRCIHLQAMLNNAIAEAQIEAVEKVLFLSPRNLAVYITKLRKAAGKGER